MYISEVHLTFVNVTQKLFCFLIKIFHRGVSNCSYFLLGNTKTGAVIENVLNSFVRPLGIRRSTRLDSLLASEDR